MKALLITAALGAAIISAPVAAQAPQPNGQRGGGFMQKDQTRAEAQQRADMMFQMLDTNRDGTVTRAEAEQVAAQFAASRGGDNSGRGGGRIQRMIDQAFGTAQAVTLPQFEAQSLVRFDAADVNHDGVVSVAERQQAREQRAEAQTPAAVPALPPRQ